MSLEEDEERQEEEEVDELYDEYEAEEEKGQKRRVKAEGGWITINNEALDYLINYPTALLLYLWYCEKEQHFPGRLIPVGWVNYFVWHNQHPFNKEKKVNKARGTLFKSGLFCMWINEKTNIEEYYQTKYKPHPSSGLDMDNFGASWMPECIYFDEEELKEYKAANPPLIPEQRPKRLP